MWYIIIIIVMMGYSVILILGFVGSTCRNVALPTAVVVAVVSTPLWSMAMACINRYSCLCCIRNSRLCNRVFFSCFVSETLSAARGLWRIWRKMAKCIRSGQMEPEWQAERVFCASCDAARESTYLSYLFVYSFWSIISTDDEISKYYQR